MARIAQEGCNYFNVDVNMFSNRKITRLRRHHKHIGFYIYFALMTQIYGNKGYYMQWDKEEAEIFSEQHNIKLKLLNKVIKTCLELDLFDKKRCETYGILTSKGIQIRFLQIKTKSSGGSLICCMPLFFIKPKYYLLYGHETLKTNHFLKNFIKVSWEKYIQTIIENDIIISKSKFENEGAAIAFYFSLNEIHSSDKKANTCDKNSLSSEKYATKEKKVKEKKIK